MSVKILLGNNMDTLKGIPSLSVQTVVTSPPYYGLRDYGMADQLGLEESPEAYVEALVSVFREVKRTLRDDGTLWLNLGDSYSNAGTRQGDRGGSVSGDINEHRKVNNGYRPRVEGLKNKDLIGIPWMAAFALRADGWYLRSEIIWAKPNPMPESVVDRPTKSHEQIFLLSKSASYYYNKEAISEKTVTQDQTVRDRDTTKLNNVPGRTKMGGLKTNNYETRNKRDVWTVNAKPYKGAHFATFNPELIEPCILAGSKEGDIVLDPFNGSGTTGEVAIKHNRSYIGCELNPAYVELTHKRLASVPRMFSLEAA